MAIAAAASRGDLASAKAVWQRVSKERGEGDRINQLEALYSTSLADWEWKFLRVS